MKHFGLLVVFGIATDAVAGISHADDAYARISFVGSVVNSACSSGVPPLGVQGGVGGCGALPSARAVYVEQMGMATGHSGIAMLDYFVGRADGGRKFVVTRQYR
ncbi:hypothetical protein [Dyella japonica]|uniref:Uncharacterized protein n=1 Tax=Dyella japonica A8 TaxID=1217721 RepID=A0A075JX67_9GAMM|nr:hypothetical protein [Dyella japonica]AIF46145.1 hypothetical protein HY57_02195 [Dyella japonica A8]